MKALFELLYTCFGIGLVITTMFLAALAAPGLIFILIYHCFH